MTQCQRLLQELKRRPLTKAQAYKAIGAWNIGARILELRQVGHVIRTDMIEVKSRYGTSKVARYSLVKERKK